MIGANVRKHLRLRIALAGAALLAGLAVYFCSRPVFYSRAVIRVGEAVDGERLRAIAKDIVQPQILERTASRLGVKATATELRKSYLFDVAARSVPRREIEIEVWTHSKDWAARWTETLVSEFADFRSVQRRKETADAIKSLNREMIEIAARLGQPGVQDFNATDKAGLAGEFDELNEIRSPARELARLGKRIDELGPVREGLLNPDFSIMEKLSLIAAFEQTAGNAATSWTDLDERRRALSALLPGIPDRTLADDAGVLALGAQIDQIDKKLQAEFDTNFRRIDVDYRNLVDQKAALEAKAAEPAAPSDAAMNEQLRHIAQRIETIGTIGRADGGDLTYTGFRQFSDRPVAPSLLKIALGSLLGGGLLAMGAPLLAGCFTRKRMDVAQLASTLGIRGLGSIPQIENLPPHTIELVENLHTIRESLQSTGETPRVIMVTSAMPGEGKTLVAANLAIAFAEDGVRTLLIDTDLRRGRVHRHFGHRPAPGLSGVLLGESTLDEAIREISGDKLFVLNAGKRPGIPLDLLASDRFTAAMKTLRENHALIVIDAPPVLGLPATLVLQPHVDAVVLVVASDRTPAHAAKAAVEALRSRGANICGLVVNREK